MLPRDRKQFPITLFLVLAVSILGLGGCRRFDQKTDTSPTMSQPNQTQAAQSDLGGEELEALIQNLEIMNRDADALEDIDTLDELSLQDTEGNEIVVMLQSLEAANQEADDLDDLTSLDGIASGYEGGEAISSLLGALSLLNEIADPVIELSNLP